MGIRLALLALLLIQNSISAGRGTGATAATGGGGTAPTLVRQAAFVGVSAASTLTATASAAPLSTNIEILLYATSLTSGATSPTVTQTNVSWAHLTGSDAVNTTSGVRVNQIWCGTVSASAGTAITLGLPASMTTTGSATGVVLEVSGTAGCGSITTVAGTSVCSTATPFTPNITPSAGQTGIFVAATRIGGAAVGPGGTPTNGFTALALDSGAIRDEFSYLTTGSTSGSAVSTAWQAGTGQCSASIAFVH